VSLWGRKNFGFEHKNAKGRAGGILIAWDKNKVKAIDSRIDDFSISIRCTSVKDSFKWMCTRVYSPIDASSRWKLWEELRM